MSLLRDMRSSKETGEYKDLDSSFASLLGQLKASGTIDENQRRFVISCSDCRLKRTSKEWRDLRDAILEARARGVGVVVYFSYDSGGSINALAAERFDGTPLIAKVELPETEKRFYGRVVDGFLVEVNEYPGICGQGPFLRIRDAILARSIELRLLQITNQHYNASHLEPTSEPAHY